MSQHDRINKNTSLFLLTWPILVELLLQMLIGNVDQMMISRYSQNAVAAIGNVNQIMNLLLITFNIITMATTIMVSQYLGSNNQEKVSEIYSLATYTNLFFSMILGALMVFGHKPMFEMMGMPLELYSDATIYMVIVGGAHLFTRCVYVLFCYFQKQWLNETDYDYFFCY